MQKLRQHHGLHTRCTGVVRISRALHSRRPATTVLAAAQTDVKPAAEQAAALKQDIIALSGNKYGHNLSDATRQQVQAMVKQLEDLQLPVRVSLPKLTGTTWTTVYTTFTGASSGKVGPFITDVVQVFPADEPGVYLNESRLGLVCARLRGDYAVTRDDRVDLKFENLVVKVGPFQAAKKEFGADEGRGHWQITYCDDDFRVFHTNMGNIFVLRTI